MSMSNFDKVVEQVKTLNRAEWWRLRGLLEMWLEPPQKPMTEAQFKEELLKKADRPGFWGGKGASRC